MPSILRKKISLFAQCQRGVAFVEFAISVSLLIFLFLGTVEITRYVLILQKLQYAVNKETNIFSSISASAVSKGSLVIDGPAISGMAGTPTLDLMLAPYTFENVGMLIISDILYDALNIDATHPNGQPTVEWRFCSSTGLQGTLATSGGTNAYVDANGFVQGNPSNQYNNQSPIPGMPVGNLTGGTAYSVKGTYSQFGKLGGPAIMTSFPTLTAPGAFNQGDEIITAEIFYSYTPAVTAQFLAPQLIYVNSISVPRYGSLAGLVWSGGYEGFSEWNSPSALFSNTFLLTGSPNKTGVWTNCQ